MISGIRIPLTEPNELAVERAVSALGLAPGELRSGQLRKLSYDARRHDIVKVCSVLLDIKDEKRARAIAKRESTAVFLEKQKFYPKMGKDTLKNRPVVVGFGPAGIFAAYLLAERGYRPLVFERGTDIECRTRDVELFIKSGKLNPDSNVQFGEGGAGTFSDGKLTTRINDPLCEYVLQLFVSFGAPQSILYEAKPHIGTDLLGDVVRRIRNRIIELGGEVRFSSGITDISVSSGRLTAVATAEEKIFTNVGILATGHSARDVFTILYNRGARLLSKPFAIGLRVEHLQDEIDRALWGREAGNPLLPKADYALSTQSEGRSVYTFCMCPGGSVAAATSERDAVVVNGMSRNARDGENANSAVVVSVGEEDFSSDPFAAIEFQRLIEKKAFLLGGATYAAPSSDMSSFLNSKTGLKIGNVEPSYPLGVMPANFDDLLGDRIANSLRLGILEFSEKIRCFDSANAILTGIESRTSSPVRVERRENREAVGIDGLFPVGEGAGYAGGIMSSAVDALKTAAQIIERYRPPA